MTRAKKTSCVPVAFPEGLVTQLSDSLVQEHLQRAPYASAGQTFAQSRDETIGVTNTFTHMFGMRDMAAAYDGYDLNGVVNNRVERGLRGGGTFALTVAGGAQMTMSGGRSFIALRNRASTPAYGSASAPMLGSDWEAVLSSRYGAANVEWTSRAIAPTPKFSAYVLKPGATHGKDVVFRSLGYTVDDSRALARLWEIQASEQFARGNYSLGKLSMFGQHIDIEIRLPGIRNAVGQESFIRSGWMMQPDGHITLNTPFSGFTR